MWSERLFELSLTPDRKTLLGNLHLTKDDLLHPGFEWNHQIPQIEDEPAMVRALSISAFLGEAIRQAVLDEVLIAFQGVTTKDLFLRGSAATGFFPLGDFDISHYGPGAEYSPDKWPQQLMGVPISWGNVPLEELSECMNSSLRMSASALEAIPISQTTKEVSEIIDSAKQSLKGPRKYYYLIFRRFEQLRDRFEVNKYLEGYDLRKEVPGGKRTIQRICWTMQAIDGDLSGEVNPDIVLMRGYYKGAIPLEVVENAFQVMLMLKGGLYSESRFSASTTVVQNWYLSHLIPRAEREIQNHIDPKFLLRSEVAMNVNSPPGDISQVIYDSKKQDEPYKKWLLLWIVSHNPSLDPECQYDLWRSCLGKMVYRNTLRNLLRNPNFPIGKVTRNEVEYDQHLLDCYEKMTATNHC